MRKCRVGVLLGVSDRFHCTVANAIRLMLGESRDFSFTCLSSSLTEDSIRSQVLKPVLSSNPYDVFVAIGQRGSVAIKTVLNEIGGHPTIFVGVRDPLVLNLIDSLEVPGGTVSAVVREPQSNLAVAEKLALIGPYIKSVIIPYWPLGEAGNLSRQVVEVIKFLRAHRINVKPISVDTAEGALEALSQTISRHDVVLLLEGNITGGLMPEIAYLCQDRDALLCADNLEAMTLGASCALGGDLYPFAEGVMRILASFWYDKVPMGLIPAVRLPNNRVFVINTVMFRMIGLPDEALDVFKDMDGVLIVKNWVSNPMRR